ncbi:MAG: hypothetical protein E3K37_18235 [Candidatus Kuenenia sp.]|nr:hypothetical protein [Candidatus Kuenenia hertensis]
MVVKTSLNSLVNLIEDSDACSEWNYRCIKEEVLKIVSPTERYKRIEFSTPLIFPNRDSIIYTVRTQDPVTKTVTITFTGKPDFLPKQPSFVRIPKVSGSWILRPLNEDYVELIYQTYSEPGGMVAPIFANQGNQNWVLQTLTNMKDMLNRKKYKNADGLVEELILKK